MDISTHNPRIPSTNQENERLKTKNHQIEKENHLNHPHPFSRLHIDRVVGLLNRFPYEGLVHPITLDHLKRSNYSGDWKLGPPKAWGNWKLGGIYIPGTQMTLVLNGKGLLLEGSNPKIEDKQVPGIYIYIPSLKLTGCT